MYQQEISRRWNERAQIKNSYTFLRRSERQPVKIGKQPVPIIDKLTPDFTKHTRNNTIFKDSTGNLGNGPYHKSQKSQIEQSIKS